MHANLRNARIDVDMKQSASELRANRFIACRRLAPHLQDAVLRTVSIHFSVHVLGPPNRLPPRRSFHVDEKPIKRSH